MKTPLTVLVSSLIFTVPALAQQAAHTKHAILIAGKPSHGPGQHEHNAGVLLLKKCLDESGLPIKTTVKLNADWPSKAELASADTVLIYCDGGKHHLLLQDDRLQQLATEIKRGCGLLCLHYAVEYPKDNGGPEMLDWMGGFFEEHWSVNPHWDAEFKGFPKHPISSGLQPYTIRDEWYFHMRFADPAKGQLTHILSAIAPDSTMSRKDGPHEGNPAVRKAVADKIPQTTAWAFVRKDGGRGFGFTGGHFHHNWGNDNQRKLVLNAILWTAKADVPTEGVPSKVTAEELEANQDPKGAAKAKPQAQGQASTDHGDCKQCAFSAAAF
jgi:type 1 glutamine amidotransferase